MIGGSASFQKRIVALGLPFVHNAKPMRNVTLCLLLIAAASAGAAPREYSVQRLASLERATRGDALYAVALLIDGQKAPRTYEAVADRVVRAGRVRKNDVRSPDEACTAGYASMIFLEAMGEEGGVVYKLTGPSQRYAYNHLKFLRMVPEGGPQHLMSGRDLMGLLALARKRAGRAGRNRGGS
jgi:hypothetical protein